MIYSLEGKIHKFNNKNLILKIGGFFYEIEISKKTKNFIKSKKLGETVIVYSHFHFSENFQKIYGFFDQKEKELFLEILRINKFGSSLVMKIFSKLYPEDLILFINNKDINSLIEIKGIGKKTAEILIFKKKDIIKFYNSNIENKNNKEHLNNNFNEALEFLLKLGFKKNKIKKLFTKIDKKLSTKNIIKELLKIIN